MNKREFLQRARQDGWSYLGLGGGGHMHFRHDKTGAQFHAPSTPSDHRSYQNAISDMRRKAREAMERKKENTMSSDEKLANRIVDAINNGALTPRSAIIRALKSAERPLASSVLMEVVSKTSDDDLSNEDGAIKQRMGYHLRKLVQDQDVPVFKLKRGLYVYDPALRNASEEALREAGKKHGILWGPEASEELRDKFLVKHHLKKPPVQQPEPKQQEEQVEQPKATPPPARRTTAERPIFEGFGKTFEGDLLVRSDQGELYVLVPFSQAA